MMQLFGGLFFGFCVLAATALSLKLFNRFRFDYASSFGCTHIDEDFNDRMQELSETPYHRYDGCLDDIDWLKTMVQRPALFHGFKSSRVLTFDHDDRGMKYGLQLYQLSRQNLSRKEFVSSEGGAWQSEDYNALKVMMLRAEAESDYSDLHYLPPLEGLISKIPKGHKKHVFLMKGDKDQAACSGYVMQKACKNKAK